MKFLEFNSKVSVLNLLKMEKLKSTLFMSWYFKKLLLSSVASNLHLKKKNSVYMIFKLSFFPSYSNITQHNTSCFKTGSSHMPFRFSLLSRMHMRLYMKFGLLPHVCNVGF